MSSDQAVIDLIAKHLAEGFVHPGDPKRDLPPRPIVLPFQRRPHMPKEMGDLMDETVKLLAECIVSTITSEGGMDLVPRKDHRAMKRAVGRGDPNPIATPVFCQCNAHEPLTYLTILDPEAITIFGPSLIKAMHDREIACPHDEVKR